MSARTWRSPVFPPSEVVPHSRVVDARAAAALRTLAAAFRAGVREAS